ncbi:hypothetical protein [Actinomadura hibisca]|uniref:hypothetical protein n=1 Tax=Actinomadura hibisca TaxID=68565 RepID=UPI00082AD37E|nr:hypothetical protein [Actinomadura hibisca]
MARLRVGVIATVVVFAGQVSGPALAEPQPPTGCDLTFVDEHPYRHYYWRNCSATNARVEVGYRNGSRVTVCVESFHYRHLARRHHDEDIPISWARRVGTCP